MSEVTPEVQIVEETIAPKEESQTEVATKTEKKSANTSEVITEEEEAANAESNKDVEATLAVSKEDGKITVNALKNLTADQKSIFLKQIDSILWKPLVGSGSSVDWVVSKAKALNTVMGYPNLNAEDVKQFTSVISSLGGNILDALTATQKDIDTEVMRAKVISDVRGTKNLEKADVDALVVQANKATSSGEADRIVQRAKDAAAIRVKDNLTVPDKNVFAKQIIESDPMAAKRADQVAILRTTDNLTTDDITTLRGKMINASDSMLTIHAKQTTSISAIRGNEKLKAEHDRLATQMLNAANEAEIISVNLKADEITKVYNMGNLKPEEMKKLADAMVNAKSDTEVKELANKAAAMDEIRGRTITEPEQTTLNDGIFKAKEGGGLPILGWGKVTVDAQVNAAKDKASMVEEVRGMDYLTPTEKNAISKTIMEAGSKDVADFEIERAKNIDRLRARTILTQEDKDAIAAQMSKIKDSGTAADSMDFALSNNKADLVEKIRKNYTNLTETQREKLIKDVISGTGTILDNRVLDAQGDAVNQINAMSALTQSEKNVFIKEIEGAKSQADVQKILERANKLHEEMKSIGGSKLDLDITNDVKVKYPQTDRNIKLESLSVRYIQKNQETNKDGRVMLNAHVRVPWGLNIQQLISNEGIYLQIPHTLGTDFEVEFIQNGQKQKVKWDPAGGTWRMETGGMLIVSGNEDLEIRVSFKPKKLEKSDFLTIGYERQKNIIDTWLTGGINDQIIIEFGDAAEDINNLHDANQGVDKIIEEAVTDDEKKDAQDLREELDKITDSDKLKDFLDKIEKLQELKSIKEKAVQDINNLNNLSQAEKDAFIEQIKNADKATDVNKIVEDARKKDAQNLAEAQKEATDAIDALLNLSDEDKQKYKEKITGWDKISEMNPILEEALAQDEKILKDAQEKANQTIDTIDTLDKLDDGRGDHFKELIDKAETTKEIDVILEEAQKEHDANKAKQEAEDALNKAKEDAIKNIKDNMTNLSDEQQKHFEKLITDATTIDEVKAFEKEAQILNDKMKEAQDKIKDLPKLNDKERQDLNDKLEGTKSEADINKVLEEAEKQKAKEDIDKMVNLSKEEKDAVKAEIDGVTDIKDIKPIVDKAEKKDAENLKNAQEGKDNDNNKPDQIGQTPLINLIIKSGDKILLNISDVVNNKDSKHDEWKQFVENTHAFENHVRQWGKKHGYELTEIQVREIQVLMSMLMSEWAAKANSFENGKAYEVVVEMVPVDSKDDSNKSTDDDKNGIDNPKTDGKDDSNKSTDTDKNETDKPKIDGKDDSNKSIDTDKNETDKPKTDGKDDSNKSTDDDKNGTDKPKTDGKNGVIENMAFDANKSKADNISLKDAVELSGSEEAEQEELPNTGSETTNTAAALAGLAILLGTMGTFFRRKKD